MNKSRALSDQSKFAELGFVPARSYCIYPLDGIQANNNFRASSHVFSKDYLSQLDVKIFAGMILLDPVQNYECLGCYYEMWVDILITYYTYINYSGYSSKIFYFFKFDPAELKNTIKVFKDKPKLQKELERKVCSQGLIEGFTFLKKILAVY